MTEREAGAPRVLVADDDPAVRSALERVLRFNGYEVELAADGLETLEAIDRAAPDAVVLDWRMPNLDGLGTCRMLRGRSDDLPVLLLTARDGLGDRVTGLDAGADDYIAKPFELEELTARLRALLRRSRGFGAGPADDEVLRFAGLTMNVDTREVRRDGRPLHLTRTEFDLLELLMRQPRRVLERTRIHEEVWGFDFGRSSNSLHVYIGYLRRDDEQAAVRTAVRLDRIVPPAVERVRLRAPGATFETRLEPWLVHGSEPALVRAVTNLLDNAVKFSPPDGTVRVVLRGGELLVADEGPGIPEETLPHVFERFYRAPEARALPGSGLGLAIVRHTAEQHGGTVSACNRPEGGALMRLRLPGTPGGDARRPERA